MGRETKDKRLLLKIQAGDSARRIKCPPAALSRFRSSPLSGELSLRAWSTARCRGNFFSRIVAQFRREKIHRRTQDRHEAAPCARRVAQDRDAGRATLQRDGSRTKIVGASNRGSTCKTFGVVACDCALLKCDGPPQDGFAVANLTPLLQCHATAIPQRNSLAASSGCLDFARHNAVSIR